APRVEEHWLPVGAGPVSLASSSHVWELEAHDADASLARRDDALGDRGHPRVVHRGTGAMREHQDMWGAGRPVGQEIRPGGPGHCGPGYRRKIAAAFCPPSPN